MRWGSVRSEVEFHAEPLSAEALAQVGRGRRQARLLDGALEGGVVRGVAGGALEAVARDPAARVDDEDDGRAEALRLALRHRLEEPVVRLELPHDEGHVPIAFRPG